MTKRLKFGTNWSLLVILILSVVSAFSEEDLTLLEEEPLKSPKPLLKSQLNTNSEDHLVDFSTPQNENKSRIPTEYLALFEKKQYSKLTSLLWSKVSTLNRDELLLLTKAHFLNKDYNDTFKSANLLLAKNDKDEVALTYLGLSYLRRKKDREAKEFLRKANEINPVYSPAIDGLVEIYENSKNYYELRLIYLDLIKKFGEKPDYLKKLCDINTKDGINDSAIEYCKKGITADPKTPENHVNLGLAYKNTGDHDMAKKILSAATIKFPGSDYAQFQNALYLEEQKNYVDAYKFYNLCKKANPAFEKCWIGLATSSYQLLKFQDAYDALKKACEFNRKNSFVGRKAALQARNAKQSDWAKKFESLADICGH